MKQIKVTDELHALLREKAEASYRSMSGQLEYLLSLDDDKGTPLVPISNPNSAPLQEQPTKSTWGRKKDVLTRMDEYKAHQAEELEYCQDPETRKKIEQETKDTLDALWAEYNQIDGTE